MTTADLSDDDRETIPQVSSTAGRPCRWQLIPNRRARVWPRARLSGS